MAPAIDDRDKRSERVDSRVSPRELALIEKLAAEQDIPVSQWGRDAFLEKLRREAGYEDEARRAAPRRRNYKPRIRTAGGQQREEAR
jgi:hypothetical protein